MCDHFGVESESAFILSNGIFITAGNEKESVYAQVRHIPVRGAQLDRVAAVNQLSREIVEGHYTIEEVREQLNQIENMPRKTKQMQILASAVGSACFCIMFGGSFRDSLGTFIAGFLLYVYVLELSQPRMSKIIGNICLLYTSVFYPKKTRAVIENRLYRAESSFMGSNWKERAAA